MRILILFLAALTAAAQIPAPGQGSGGGSSSGLADPGSNSVVYRSASNTTTPATATEMAGPLYCADAGSNDTYACSLSPAISSYGSGVTYRFKANTSNTGAASINFNSLGAKTIVKVAGGVTTTLADNDIRAGQLVELVYDGTNMQMASQLGNSASGGGNSTTTGAYASNPGTCTDGDLRLPDDSAYILRCASNVWVHWGTVQRQYDPALASITTPLNFGSSTAVTTKGGIILTVPAGSGTRVRGLEKNVPSAPYSITATFQALIMNTDYMTCGIYLSDGTKLFTAALAYSSFYGGAPLIRVAKWNSVTSFLGDYFTTFVTPTMMSNGNLIIKVNDNNTNRITSICMDSAGDDCDQINSVSRTDHLTPTKAGIFCNSENTTYAAKMWLKSWREQ